ncbi:hypothetical protein VTK56DRAFT_10230 [Thermocarpiscus australiensis]
MLEWVNSIPNDGLIRYLGPFNQERILITSPKALAEVLATKNYDFVKPAAIRHSIGRVLGIGVLLAEGEEHKVQRKNLLPAFASRRIKELYPVFWEKAREGVEAMTEHILQEAAKRHESPGAEDPQAAAKGNKTAVIEVINWASRITLDIIGVAGLGRNFRAIPDPENELCELYARVFTPRRGARITGLLSFFVPGPILARLPIARNKEIRQAVRMLRSMCAELISDKKAKLARKEPVDLDILSVAIESGAFTDENLVDQVMTFLAAGHETTGAALTWATYLLAKHPEVQARLRAEIREHLPPISDPGSMVSSQDIERLPYLNAVCSEVLRCYSPVPISIRQPTCDITIQGQFVPKGTHIMIVPWAINKSKSLWGEDALEFKPDRWLHKSEGDKLRAIRGEAGRKWAFLTFLHGPRSCMGQGFARAEFACLLASWVGRFALELANKEEEDESKIEIRGAITARPAKGMYIRATVLDGW